MRRFAAILCALLAGALPAAGRDATLLEKRIQVIRALIAEEPEVPEMLYHPDFLAAVPVHQLEAIGKTYYTQGGAVKQSAELKTKGEHYGEYLFTTEKGMSFTVKLGLDKEPPFRINTLWFGLMQPALKSPEEFLEKLELLEGKVSFALWRLGGKEPEKLYELNPDLRLAIGSTFKLYILGALVDDVDEGRHAWDEVILLRKEWYSWPSGALHKWPERSPVTLHSLACGMISISDNTATDHLLFHLGRERVEDMLEPMGHERPERNKPFLGTAEMFRIKEMGRAKERVEAYLSKDVPGRRRYLKDVIARLDRENIEGLNSLSPTAVDRVEWFASAADLCRAMDWLRVHPDPSARGILAINPGLVFPDKDWRYVGYKGGSEAGVLNLTWLLEREDGAWFALSAGWNNPSRRLDDDKFMGLLQGFLNVLGEEKESEEDD